MSMKEDIAVLKNDTRWIKSNITNISESVQRVADAVEKVAEVAYNNKKEIARLKGIGAGIGVITVLISIISFFSALG